MQNDLAAFQQAYLQKVSEEKAEDELSDQHDFDSILDEISSLGEDADPYELLNSIDKLRKIVFGKI
jgi:hypothetical protein